MSNNQAQKAIEKYFRLQMTPIYEALIDEGKDIVSIKRILEELEKSGLLLKEHHQLQSLSEFISKSKDLDATKLNFDEFLELVKENGSEIIQKALLRNLAIPDFQELVKDVKAYFKKTKGIKKGEVSEDEVKTLYGLSICTVDGQRFSIGDHKEKFLLQSVSKAINYAIALHEVGEDKVHQHVGREPSGIGYNGLVLNQKNLPHNPMINAGAIMVCSLIQPQLSIKKRHQYILDIWKKICGGEDVQFEEENLSFDGSSHHRNMALSYYMLEKNAFPEDTDIYETIDLYKRCNLIEMDVDRLAVAGATLANGGVCPTTGEKVFNDDDIRDTLSLMLSCGMYDYSGEFAFLVGLPAKSGVSGALIVVVPGLMAFAIYSPPIDEMGNSVRGVAFCHELVKNYNFHKYDHIVDSKGDKKDPKKPKLYQEIENYSKWYWAANLGLKDEIQNLLGRGVPIDCTNPDQRTALHAAASEGHENLVSFLLKNGANPDLKDRWGKTPYDDAEFHDQKKIMNIISKKAKS